MGTRMQRHVIRSTITAVAMGVASAALCSTAAAEWSKTYVVEWNEPAMYYGAKSGVIDPGTDCPKGSNPEPNWVQVMVDAGYSREQAEWLRSPANPTRSPVHGQNGMAFRGKDQANVYIHPETTPDPGMLPMVGTIGEGIDLDGDPKTGFTTPTGEKGVDNEFYRALGCWKTYRGPVRLSSGALSQNDAMREGSWTVVVVVAGKGADPMNDGHVDVGFYLSPDKMVKSGDGSIARDYTFRIKPDAKFEAIIHAKSVNGRIVSTAPADEVWMRDPGYTRELQLLKARVDLTMKLDGSLVGYVGGYRPWEPIYRGWVNGRGPVIESLTWIQLPAVWYQLKRMADYSPSGPGGEKTHISFALRVEALPAFVMTPDASKQATNVASYKSVAPPAPPAVAATTFRVIDGLVPDRNNPDSMSAPPLTRVVASSEAAAARGGGK
jgi:hypothetical protein